MAVPNRLADEPSPYLQQHVQNPVDWHPWGPEALQMARDEDKPIFLSIGYSTCHWCHVMAHESFEDADVARLMNDAFVNIKVDREERPDLDETYMAACQAMTGRGGWPLTIVLTPTLEPFFSATYVPKHSRGAHLGMMDLVPRIQQAWAQQRPQLLDTASHVAQHLRRAPATTMTPDPAETAHELIQQLRRSFDATHGGFGGAPKFPSPHQLLFLLREANRRDNAELTGMALRTLRAIDAGGIHDHVGGGFHRYSTDSSWHLPHFEKMLYDQAMLLLAATEGYQAAPAEDLAAMARDAADYILHTLADPAGGLRSAEDADSDGQEGAFYVWTWDELHEVLGDDADAFCAAYNAHPEGNHHDEATGRPAGRNVLHRTQKVLDPSVRARCLQKLRTGRQRRVRPMMDRKILTDWNGLAMAGLARAGRVLGQQQYVEAARQLDAFLEHHARLDGAVHHRIIDGQAGIPGFLDDHAFWAWGKLELHQATLDAAYLVGAVDLATTIMDRFQGTDGRLHMTSADGERALHRPVHSYDGAAPSGYSVATGLLDRLGRALGRQDLLEAAQRAFDGVASLGTTPQAHIHLLDALRAATHDPVELVLTHDDGPLRDVANATYAPDGVVLLADAPTQELAPFLAQMTRADDDPVAYVCRSRSCRAPTADPSALRRELTSSVPHPNP